LVALPAPLLLMPGYILGRVLSRGVPGPELSDTAFIAATAIGGVSTHLIALVATVPLVDKMIEEIRTLDGLTRGTFILLGLWGLVVLLILPAVLGALLAWLSGLSRPAPLYWILRHLGLTRALRTVEAWNYVFERMDRSPTGSWVLVRLKEDGGSFLGQFGRKSLAASDATLRDIYLEKIWTLTSDGQPAAESPTNEGVWISGDQISSIQFLGQGEDPEPSGRTRGSGKRRTTKRPLVSFKRRRRESSRGA